MKRLIVSLLFCLLPVLALAEGVQRESKIYQPPALAEPTLEWSGAYAGLFAGLGNFDVEQWAAGGQVGYQALVGAVVIGVEADAGKAWFSPENIGTEHCPEMAELLWFGSARVRVGFPIGRLLPYATGGVGVQQVSVGGEEKWAAPWVYGAGVDLALTERVSARVEYLRFEGNVSGEAGLDTDLVRAGVNWRF